MERGHEGQVVVTWTGESTTSILGPPERSLRFAGPPGAGVPARTRQAWMRTATPALSPRAKED